MKRTFRHFLEDIVEYSDKAQKFTKDMNYEEFCSDEKTFMAVIRALEIIGEAINHIPKEIQDKSKEIPWYQIRGFRNKVVHEYFGIDKKVVWLTVKEDIPFLKDSICKILKEIAEE
ncbi:MAG: DUF86 domain-containing protein [bacterium]